MKYIKNEFALAILLILLLTIVGCNQQSDSPESNDINEDNETNEVIDDSSEKSDELHIAYNAPPPTLDQQSTAATATRDIAMLIFETLVTSDSKFQPTPMLAESIDISDDGKVYTFSLREGVKFHNGKEMTAEDVIASMESWLEKSDITGNIFVDAKWEADGDYTVLLKLARASALTLDTLATTKQAPIIMPKEIVENAPVEGIEEFIGTGPFKFEEWKQNQYIHVTKYDDYQPVDAEPDGHSGKKEALVDNIYFHIVPDTSTRLAGLQTGEYHIGYDIPFDMYDQLESDPSLDPFIKSGGNVVVKFNTKEGIASEFKLREAINTGLDYEEVLEAAFPNKDFYWMYPGYMDFELASWASEAGIEYYNQNDPEIAKQMLDDMGYNGEEVRILATRDYDYIYNLAVVINEQLKSMGINTKLEIFDWPTVTNMMNNDFDAWDITLSGSSMVSTPPQLISLSPSWAGGVNDPYILEAMEAIEFETDQEKVKELWEQVQLYAWEEHLPTIQLGIMSKLYAFNDKVNGIETLVGPILWNVSVDK